MGEGRDGGGCKETVRFRLANGSSIERDIGETQVRVDGRAVTTVVVFGEDDSPPLLGVYTLERALLAVDPVGQRLFPTDALLMTIPCEGRGLGQTRAFFRFGTRLLTADG